MTEMNYDITPAPVYGPLEGLLVPKGVRHRPKAPGGATVLMVEQKTIVPTGS